MVRRAAERGRGRATVKILVTDGNNRAALAVTRSLGRGGHEVIVGAPTLSLAHWSRYCTERVFYPDPASEPGRFVEELAEQVRAHRVDCVMPIADITTFMVTSHRDLFEPDCAVPFADAAIVERAADKVDIIETAARIGVPVPRSVVVTNASRIPDHGLAFPLVVKPWRSRVRIESGWASTSVSYAADEAALRHDLKRRARHEFPVLLQERIEGPGVGVFVCYHRGRPLTVFGHRRVRERPPWGGVSVLCESVEVRPATRDYAIRLLDAICWQGVAMVEFKVDRRDGQPKLMEINGRFWGSLQLAVDAGVDFPMLLLRTTMDGDIAPPLPYRRGVRERWLWGDFDSLLQSLRPWGGPPEQRPRRLRAIGDFLTLAAPGLNYDNPKWDDPWPFAFETRERIVALLGGGPKVRTAEAGVPAKDPDAASGTPSLAVRAAARLADTEIAAQSWNALVSSATTNTLFQTHEWTESWLDTVGAGAAPRLLVVDHQGAPAAIAPLSATRTSSRFEIVRFIGSGRADYCDFIVDSARREALPRLVDALLDDPGWDAIDLRNIPAASETPDVIKAGCEARGFRFVVRDQFTCPTLLITGHEDEALRIANKSSLRRCLRRFGQSGVGTVRHLTRASDIEPLLPLFFDQHVRRWHEHGDSSLFDEPRNREFYRRLTRALDGTGWLLFTVIELNGQPISMHFGFDYNGSLLWYKPAFDPAFSHLSPGNLMIAELLAYALAHKRRELDFTVGTEPFKTRFTNLNRKTVRVQVHRSKASHLRVTAHEAAGALRMSMRRTSGSAS